MMVLIAVFVCSSGSAVLQIIPKCEVGFSELDMKTVLVEQTVNHVLDNIIEPQLGGNVPLLLNVELVYTLDEDVPGAGAFTEWKYNKPGLIANTWYGCSIASEISGQDLKCTSHPTHPEFIGYHMYMALNKTMLDNGDFWLYKDKDCPEDKADLVTVVLHEIGHALGFKCIVKSNGYYDPDPDYMHSIMETKMCGNMNPDLDMITFDEWGHSFRMEVMQGGDVWWWGNFLRVVGERRHASRPSDPMFSVEGYVQMNTPITENSVSHWHPGHFNPDQVMEPKVYDLLFGSFMAREIGFLGPALQDMGWPNVTLFAAVPTHVSFASTDMNKGTSVPQTVVVSNSRNGTTSITAIELLGGQADSFNILSGGSPTTLPFLGTLYISLAFTPISIGYKAATLRVSYNDGTAKYVDVALNGFGITTDTDGDGISDIAETRGLWGSWTPFDSELGDSTGESGLLIGDGVLDGYNDFDGDGMSNAEEFIFGYNPADPDNFGRRSSVDTDGDGILDEYEINDPAEIFDPYFADTSGDSGSGEPDGIPDGQNDYDGDGYSNAFECQWGLNPFEPDYDVSFPASSRFALFLIVLCISSLACLYLNRKKKRC